MNVSTVVIPEEVAIEKLNQFRNVAKENRKAEDAELRRMYRAAKSGQPIIDVSNAFRETGLNEKGQPKLAIAKADWQVVSFSRWRCMFFTGNGLYKADCYQLPKDVWNWDNVNRDSLRTNVPYIPPNLRPKDDLSKYHILFEVQSWEEYAADPFLLKHITGYLFSVVAEWELTDLERALLKGRL